MPVGPFARAIAQFIVPVIAVMARAIPAAYSQALRNARTSGAATEAANMIRSKLSRDEALQILNFSTDSTPSIDEIRKQHDKYFEANAVQRGGGGSFYLQSKFVRAKELLEEYEKDQKDEERDTSNER